ncbi:hypothetical protein [Streptomyces adustus]|uniref:hypothetical protein n=1 Tax=Streptomyces adustus TaxID=1609272 RepID=UPI00370FB15C
MGLSLDRRGVPHLSRFEEAAGIRSGCPVAEWACHGHGWATRRRDRAVSWEHAVMLACGCMNLMDIVAALTGYGLLGIAGLAVGLVCLIGLLLGAFVTVGHLIRRQRGGDPEPAETSGRWREESPLGSFRWEDSPE